MIREKHIARTAQAARTARVLRSGFAAFVAGVAALCCTACINDYPDEAAPVRFPDGESIALQVSMFDIIDDADDAVPDVERMHNLRVIITHKEMLDGAEHEVIEYNRLIEFGDGNRKYRYGYVEDPRLMFKIERGTPSEKHIYLFANSEPILNGMLGKGDLASLTAQPDPEAGIYGGNHYDKIGQDIADSYLKALREVTFSNDELQYFVKPDDGSPANGIPMSAEYDIRFDPGNAGIADVYIMNAYIVRAANKITFEYVNERPQYPIFVQKLGVEQCGERCLSAAARERRRAALRHRRGRHPRRQLDQVVCRPYQKKQYACGGVEFRGAGDDLQLIQWAFGRKIYLCRPIRNRGKTRRFGNGNPRGGYRVGGREHVLG